MVRRTGVLISRTFVAMMAIALIATVSTNWSASALKKESVQNHKLLTPASIVSQFLISTSAAYNANPPQVWDRFVERVQNQSVRVCMMTFGFKGRELRFLSSLGSISFGVDNTDYPDVRRLQTGNLGLVPITDIKGRPTVPAREAAAFRSDYGKCHDRPLTMFASVDKLLDPMLRVWDGDISKVAHALPIIEATKQWSTCVALRGVPAASPASWFAKLDRLIQNSERDYSDPYVAPKVVARVRIYGDCVSPLARAMDRVRLKDRARLLGRFGHVLPILAKRMNELIKAYD